VFAGRLSVGLGAEVLLQRTVTVFDLIYADVTVLVSVMLSVTIFICVDWTTGVVVPDIVTVGVN
jgi:hypothetical protein